MRSVAVTSTVIATNLHLLIIPSRHMIYRPAMNPVCKAFENAILGKDILGAGQIDDGYRVQQS